MPAEDRQPELGHRIIAAAGSSVLSALLVNPLDVVKTRIQAASMVADRPLPSCLLTRMPARYPVRWARSLSLADCQSKLTCSPAAGCSGTPQPVSAAAARPLLGQLPMSMSSCACALKVADLGPASLGSSERCVNRAPFRPVTSTGVLRDIVRKEGVTALWRGADTAVLAAFPMVGVYMPLYDALLQQATPSLGAYTPAVAGSAARTIAVLLVGPLELVRTRQQGSAAGARTAWGALRDTLRDTAAAAAPAPGIAGAGGGTSGGTAPGQAAGASLATVLRTLPRLWTGVSATLARDVPFSALYWALVEPLRGSLLARWGHERQQQQQPAQEQTLSPESAMAPSGRAVLAANLIAGSTAGAAAAVVTTPFDVVKTRLQVGDVSARASTVAVVRQVMATEGLAGLFRGWVPRAARTAPACAVVVSSYEVLKLLL